MSTTRHTNCEGMTRRDGLRLGLGGFMGIGLATAMQGRTAHATARPDVDGKPAGAQARIVHKPRGRQADACIMVWMDGGPTHYETFDPKPDAPSEIRGEFGTIGTKVPGVRFSSLMKRLAACNDKYTVIRSIRHNQNNHGSGNHYMVTGAPPRIPVGCGAFVSFHPSMGSVVAKELGAPRGMPPYFSMPSMSRSGGPNFLGGRYAPFVLSDDPNRSGFRVRDVALPRGLETGRYQTRQSLRRQMDQLKRVRDEAAGDPVNAMDEFYQQGHELVTSKQAQRAFEIDREPGHVRDRYGRTAFGQRCLLARRLVEAGVPFVTLYDGGWDHHRTIFPSLKTKLPPVEAGIAALIEDLDERGMLDRTMVVALGEFGRTPKINSRGGRDHWSSAMSVLFAGGGAPRGSVIGATDRYGYSAVDRVLSPEAFVSTVYAKLGIDPARFYVTPEGRPTALVSQPTPIAELMA